MASRDQEVVTMEPSANAENTARRGRGGNARNGGTRKGRGAKTRQSENFRTRKNEDTQKAFQDDLMSIRDSYCKFEHLDDLMKSLTVGKSISHPPVQIAIVTEAAVEDLAAETVEYMTNNNVIVKGDDRSTLSKVTSLQVMAKVAVSNRNGPFENSTTNDTVVNTVLSHFSKGLKSTAVLIDQIGGFELNEQKFSPKLAKEQLVVETPPGFQATEVTMNKARLYVRLIEGEVIRTPEDVLRVPADRRMWMQHDVVNVTRLAESYGDLLQRLAKKMSHSVISIDLASGKGGPSQLVGSVKNPRYGAEVDAWCIRPVPLSVLIQGAAWGFGLDSTDPWHQAKTASVSCSIDTAAFYKKLMRSNEKQSDTR